MNDKTITCSDCRQEFVFTIGEQEFFATKTDSQTGQPYSDPKRCKDCRAKKKANQNQSYNRY